jgi:aryl-alcohol dehydrogenase-like predicted oxidoreductase
LAAAHPLGEGEASDIVSLNRAHILASRQGFGVGDGSSEAFRAMGQAGFTRLVRHALDHGVRYFDLLPGPAHELMAAALKGVPRDRYTLVTNFRHPEEPDAAKMLDRFLLELRTDYLDAVLVGAILTRDWAAESKWAERRDLLSAAKQSGKVRAVGASVHGWEALRSLPGDSWVELAMVSCNHRGDWMDAPPGPAPTAAERRDASVPLIAEIHRAGIGVAAMKVFAHTGYREAQDPAAERSRAIEFVLGLGTIATLPILYHSTREFDETRTLIHRVRQRHGRSEG